MFNKIGLNNLNKIVLAFIIVPIKAITILARCQLPRKLYARNQPSSLVSRTNEYKWYVS